MVLKNDLDLMIAGVLRGERRALAKTITILEGKREDQREAATYILSKLAPFSGKSIRIGITGTPGVGKSTFIEALGKILLPHGHKIAILAIDPSSPLSGGSIMGDRVRMEDLSRDPNIFIRPSPSDGTLGGAARHTREAIVACEAGGYDIIIVESVGVGQSETEVASMTDCFVILQLPNAGDDIQAIKKGILELADIVVVTKADGSNLPAAKLAKEQLERSLAVARSHSSAIPRIFLVSSLQNSGIKEFWKATKKLISSQQKTGEFRDRRHSQAVSWFYAETFSLIKERLLTSQTYFPLLSKLEEDVKNASSLGSVAAMQLVDYIFKKA